MQYDKSIVAIRYWLLAKEHYKALEAMELALSKHTGKRKDNVTPAISHQLSVVYYIRTVIKSIILPEETITTAFLHDIVEDCSVTVKDISAQFGEQCAAAVRILTNRENGYRKNQEQYYSAIGENLIASIVKAGDRIHNVQTMIGVFNLDKQKEYVTETEAHVIPMIKKARRLFPQQEPAYENAKHFLQCQIELIKAIHGGKI